MCCKDRKRLTQEDQATFPANGTLNDVRKTGFLNLYGFLECCCCSDILWLETATKMDYAGCCGGLMMLLVTETIMALFIAVGVCAYVIEQIPAAGNSINDYFGLDGKSITA